MSVWVEGASARIRMWSFFRSDGAYVHDYPDDVRWFVPDMGRSPRRLHEMRFSSARMRR